MTNRVFSVRSNAIRNARLIFGKAAKEGTEFSVSKVEGGFSWAPLVDAPAKPVMVAAEAPATEPVVVKTKPVKRAAAKAKVAKKASKKATKFVGPLFRDKSKTLKLLKMISAEKGASLNALVNALGWQKHTIRGRISTFRHEEKLSIKSYKDANRGRVYQVA